MDEEIIGRTTADRFHLTAKVHKKRMAFRDHQSRGKESNETAETIVLVPEQATESDLFFNAWLPPKLTAFELDLTKGVQPHVEFVMETGFPLNGYFRGALCHANNLLNRPHIFVMTRKAEEILGQYVGKKIKITTLGDGEEDGLYELKPETKSPIAGMI
jgi:hypothetical protein